MPEQTRQLQHLTRLHSVASVAFVTVALRAEITSEEWAQLRVAALKAGVSAQEYVGSLLRASLGSGRFESAPVSPRRTATAKGSGEASRASAEDSSVRVEAERGRIEAPTADRGSAAPNPRSASSRESAFAEDHELPWLPALQRRATARDYEDANFDPEDYQ